MLIETGLRKETELRLLFVYSSRYQYQIISAQTQPSQLVLVFCSNDLTVCFR